MSTDALAAGECPPEALAFFDELAGLKAKGQQQRRRLADLTKSTEQTREMLNATEMELLAVRAARLRLEASEAERALTTRENTHFIQDVARKRVLESRQRQRALVARALSYEQVCGLLVSKLERRECAGFMSLTTGFSQVSLTELAAALEGDTLSSLERCILSLFTANTPQT